MFLTVRRTVLGCFADVSFHNHNAVECHFDVVTVTDNLFVVPLANRLLRLHMVLVCL